MPANHSALPAGDPWGSDAGFRQSIHYLYFPLDVYSSWHGTSVPVRNTSPRRQHFTTKAPSVVYFRRRFRAFVKTSVCRRSVVHCCLPKALEHSTRRHHICTISLCFPP